VKATLPERSATPFGDMKIPEPNIQGTKFDQFHELYNKIELNNIVWGSYGTYHHHHNYHHHYHQIFLYLEKKYPF